MRKKSIEYGGTSLNYLTTGEGFPIVLLHGFAEDHTIWDEQIKYLRTDYKVIAVDLFGAGDSPHLDKIAVQVMDYASAIKQIVVVEKIEKFILLGHSMGGYIGLTYCDKFPNDIIGLGLIHSTVFGDDEAKINMRKKSIQFIQTNGAAAFLKTSVPDLFYNKEKNKPFIDALIEKGSRIAPESLIQYYEAIMNRVDYATQLAFWNIPILFICGKHDKAVPIERSLQQISLGKTVCFTMLKGSAHMGLLEEPDVVNQKTREFIQFCLSK